MYMKKMWAWPGCDWNLCLGACHWRPDVFRYRCQFYNSYVWEYYGKCRSCEL